MKLHSVTEMGEAAGVCCRQSPLRGAVGALIFSAILVGTVFLLRHGGMPWFVWGVWAVVVGLIVPVVIRDSLAKFRPTNWVVRVDPDGLWINLRSGQKRAAAEAATVVRLNYEEIDHAHRHIDAWTTRSTKGGSCYWKLESLELDLASDNTRDLERALAEERASGKGASPSVTVPAPSVIRIAWWGSGLNHDVTPALRRVLAEMSGRVTVTDATRTSRRDWHRLNEAELNEQIEHLVRWGLDGEATELLMHRRSYSATEAHKFVAEVAARM